MMGKSNPEKALLTVDLATLGTALLLKSRDQPLTIYEGTVSDAGTVTGV